MTSKLVLDNLAGRTTAGSITIVGEGNSTTTNLQQGLAKSWASFDGDASGTPVFDSFNVSSISDTDTGIYLHNFSSNMSNDDYVVSCACSGDSSSNTMALITNYNTHTTATTGIKTGKTDDFSRLDTPIAHMLIHGDLA